jgi:hypothetical protein
MNTIQSNGWKTNPLIIITTRVRGAIHEHSINKLINLKMLKSTIKTLTRNIYRNINKYLTYMVLNQRKFENKQAPIPPPPQVNWEDTTTPELTS